MSRIDALDIHRSFIVQAPAGSGKTELLMQRYLRLLANACHHPEEIIALTFTRKAAAEMRDRIITALEHAATHPQPLHSHEQLTWTLARQALEKDEQAGWRVLDYPHRLRILTIDALNSLLCSQDPLLSHYDTISEEPDLYYENAITQVLSVPDPVLHPALTTLLLHLDNRPNTLIRLLIPMLAQREQWLPHLLGYYHNPDVLRARLEDSLQNLIQEAFDEADRLMPAGMKKVVLDLMEFAKHHGLTLTTDWRGIAEFLLTKTFSWRKTVNIHLGFPPIYKTEKKAMQAILDTLENLTEESALRNCLSDILHCPPPYYTDQQWECIEALMQVLPFITAQLQIEFQKNNTLDFPQLSLNAFQALGTAEAPTDLALTLDYRIQHILMDEFQDTSVTQYHLLEKIVQEWQPDDGKTLFLVGDPMQSIYRFRQAEVSLFLQAKKQGIASVALTSIILTDNFRSEAGIVEWINQTFKNIFPTTDDLHSGAIAYTPSTAIINTQHTEKNIHYYVAEHDTDYCEMITLVQQLRQKNPDHTIGMLVRARSILQNIMRQFNAHQIPYEAVELEMLYDRPEILDLLSLTKALLDWSDRTAWLAILRAPWCGLSLADLHAIIQYIGERPIWPLLRNYESIPLLSHDAHIRLQHCIPVFHHALAEAGRLPVATWIQNTWIHLNGPAYLLNTNAHENTTAYFELLETILSASQHALSFSLLDKKIQKLYAKTQPAPIQLMTIHKAKGLEFNHVILPELQYESHADYNQLLMWLENPYNDDLILAPIKPRYEASDAIHDYLKRLEKKKQSWEMQRLLYVATTRAKNSIHLFCTLQRDKKDDIKTPSDRSFLGLLWPHYKTHV